MSASDASALADNDRRCGHGRIMPRPPRGARAPLAGSGRRAVDRRWSAGSRSQGRPTAPGRTPCGGKRPCVRRSRGAAQAVKRARWHAHDTRIWLSARMRSGADAHEMHGLAPRERGYACTSCALAARWASDPLQNAQLGAPRAPQPGVSTRAGQPMRWIQPNGSSVRPVWMSSRAWRNCMVTGPGWPSPTVHSGGGGLHRPDRRDDGRGPAGEHLGDLAAGVAGLPVLDRDPTLLGGDAQVSGQRQQGVPRDAGQQCAGEFRGHHVADSPGPKTKTRFIPPISSTQRRSIASSQTTWSQPCSAACACGDQRRGVVARALRLAGAARSGPDELRGQPDADRLDPAREVRPGG